MSVLIGATGYYLDQSETGNLGSIGSLGRDMAVMSYDYTRSLESAGAIPIMLPVLEDKKRIETLLDRLDGLLLTGGSDVSPLLYGERPKANLGKLSTERDSFELALLDCALRRDMPVFCICRGLQMLNVALGGSLYQDLVTDLGAEHFHSHKQFRKWQATHTVQIDKDSKLYQMSGVEQLGVNSYHHQAIKALGEHLKVSALSEDHIIEAVESTYHRFVVAVQWHPEMMSEKDKLQQSLFDRFVSYVRTQGLTS
ncbi:gamma-glutamyl-gamma-aminobutyrate hydrolase family protein [Paenibacillus filicis]|uniref:Gamma-glutamyl-gamma-aminobutyrate hydrolase family protein n=1 Tax=Paenibacillus gyeongsangnamensis TaxID=3388067 RepID=A0ABT4QBR8_9BACL|nr:gamma-glutamyl-gamma-aminobutyrate hydrolase family protein [Paenibacillus filicis]MCZ8514265.1 gamma-glutamyl-gamma-aminobutyrate hydrolase family protein [Paenibacillus filicis]